MHRTPSRVPASLGRQRHHGGGAGLLAAFILVGFTFSTAPPDAFAQPPAIVTRYALSDVTANGNEVILTLTLGLRNDSNISFSSASLSVEHEEVAEDATDIDPDLVFGRFEPFDLAPHQGVRVSRQLLLNALDYDRWTHGFRPHVRLAFDDAQTAETRRVTLDLIEATEIPLNPRAY